MMLPFFFFNDTATTEIYTLSLHDALPIFGARRRALSVPTAPASSWCDPSDCDLPEPASRVSYASGDRKSTRLNSSHLVISYAVFCLKTKKDMDNCVLQSHYKMSIMKLD